MPGKMKRCKHECSLIKSYSHDKSKRSEMIALCSPKLIKRAFINNSLIAHSISDSEFHFQKSFSRNKFLWQMMIDQMKAPAHLQPFDH